MSYVFGEHPTAHLIYGALAHHNRRRVASACFALNPPDGSAARAKLVAACDTFADLAPLSVGASCGAVNAARMHVLVNLDGWTSLGRTNEIFVCGAAPRQLAYLGYPATLALESVTHFATDALSSPADSQARSPWGPGGSRRSRNVTAHSRGRTATCAARTTTPRSLRTSRAGTTPPTMERTARTAAPTRAIGRSAATGGCECATTTTCTRYAGRGLTTAGPAQLAARSRVRCFLRSLVYVFVCLFVCLRAFAKVEPTVFGIWLDAFCGTAALR